MGRASTSNLELAEGPTVPVSVRLPEELLQRLDAWGAEHWRRHWSAGGGPRLTRTAIIHLILASALKQNDSEPGPAKARPRRKKTRSAA